MSDLYLIDHAIQNAEHQLVLWDEEYRAFGKKVGNGKSNMNLTDLRFIRSRIEQLKQLRAKVIQDVAAIMKRIDKRFE